MNINVKTGLESYLEKAENVRSKAKKGLLVNPASLLPDFTPAVGAFLKKGISLNALFGPQHGIFAHTQDNMITWQGFTHPQLNIPVFSLYGEERKPTEEMLSHIDELLIDLQDTGTRVYTFASTMFHCIEVCAKFSKKVIILDRPNPINGFSAEGNVIEKDFYSFVGMLPVPMRHGLTMGEMALFYRDINNIDCHIEVIKMAGWRRNMEFKETGLPWIIPSPNMPTTDTAAVYPGTVLLEGTNISEGRGTTKPFEITGAPFIDANKIKKELDSYGLEGVVFRAVNFQPRFGKWNDDVCGGVQIHVTDKENFKPYLTGIAIIKAVFGLYEKKFRWKEPPYEYEYEKLPIDIISGSEMIRKNIESGKNLSAIEDKWVNSVSEYKKIKKEYELY